MFHTELRSFHAVASHHGFTAAGVALHIGQPTVTRQVKELEARFQVELFYRRGRRVELTPIGAELLELTRRIFTLESEATDLLDAAGAFRTGRLEVGAVGPFHVTEMLASFHERYPSLGLSVHFGNSKDVLEDLLGFRTDVAVLAKAEEDHRIDMVPYSEHPVVAFVSRRHPFCERDSLELAELCTQQVLLREEGSTTRRALEAELEKRGLSLGSVVEIGSREAVWWAVLHDLGVGVVSEYEFIPHPELKALTFSDADVSTCQHVACIAERRESPLIRAFFNVVEETARLKRRSVSKEYG